MLSVPPSPSPVPSMTSRRVPLGNISPYHINAAIPAKRSATAAKSSQNSRESQLLGPPLKKQILEDGFVAGVVVGTDQKENRGSSILRQSQTPKTPNRHSHLRDTSNQSGRLARLKAVSQSHSTSHQEKIDSLAKQKKASAAPIKTVAAGGDNAETIRQWQRHYKKQFPQLTFWFDETIPQEIKGHLKIDLLGLGSTIVSNFDTLTVTHVLTARDDVPPERKQLLKQEATDGRTIDPTLLDKSRTKKRSQDSAKGAFDDNSDILVHARLKGLKIWTVEKLQRMIKALHEEVEDPEQATTAPIQLPSKFKGPARLKKEEELVNELLEQLNREKTYGPADRDHTAIQKDMIRFKGPYLMIADITGIHRPIMVREYPKTKNPDDGEWPQFRSNKLGRCPFVLDPDTKALLKQQQLEEEIRKREDAEEEELKRALTTKMEPPVLRPSKTSAKTTSRTTLGNIENRLNRPDPKREAAATAIATSKAAIAESRSRAKDIIEGMKREEGSKRIMKGYEPIASGLRRSGPTSAVQSTTISSAAAIAGANAGTSRDVQDLQRRVFEKASGNVGVSRDATRSMGTLNIVGVKESRDNLEVEKHTRSRHARAQSELVAAAPVERTKKAALPGYCENCRDKYDDFAEHVESRRHRKYAENNKNFAELDACLHTLRRPKKTEQQLRMMGLISP